MIELVLLTISIFGHGNWACGSESIYSNGIKESIYSYVVTNDDLTYNETLVLQYKEEKQKEVQSQLKVFSFGHKEVFGSSFIAYPKKVNVVVDFDKAGLFSEDYIQKTKEYYLKKSENINVLSVTANKMILEVKETGEIANCYPR